MIRNCIAGFVFIVVLPALVEANTSLGLTPTDLDRLGVALQAPETVTAAEVAAGPAIVVIPPAREAIVTSTVSGVVSRILVAEGDVVTAGDALAEIMSSELLRLQRELVEAALTFDLASAQAARDRTLHEDGIIAERRVLESAAALRSATTGLEQIRQQLVLAGMARSDLDRLLETHELRPNLLLRAPFAATVTEQDAALGAHVDALDPVYRIADLSGLWLELRIPQERADRIRPGMRVAVSTAEREMTGDVSLIGQVADQASQTVLVRAHIDNKDGWLRPGQILSARILDDGVDGSGTLAVPGAAIVRSDGQAWVFGARDGQIMALPVDVLGEDGTRTYVRGEIGAGTRIAIGGAAALKSVWLSAQDEGE